MAADPRRRIGGLTVSGGGLDLAPTPLPARDARRGSQVQDEPMPTLTATAER